MPNRKKRMRSGALCGGLLLVLALLAALPSTLAQYTSVDWGAGDTVTMADYSVTAEHTYTQSTLPVTVSAQALLAQVDTDAYSTAVVDAAVEQTVPGETDVTCDTTLVTLTAKGTASGYFAVQSSDGTTYYSSTVLPEEHVELTLPGQCALTNDPEMGIIDIFDADGALLLTVEARWGTPPDTLGQDAEYSADAPQDALGLDVLQRVLNAELEAQAEQKCAAALTQQLQNALIEQQRLADAQDAEEEAGASEPEDGTQEEAGASESEDDTQEEAEASAPEDGAQENGSIGQTSV